MRKHFEFVTYFECKNVEVISIRSVSMVLLKAPQILSYGIRFVFTFDAIKMVYKGSEKRKRFSLNIWKFHTKDARK